uniref:Uncharacterized protein n=1 Tax=Escherichia coli TaxID=562 RepID=A0A6D1NYB4_ECOLX|nr:hypothetical protein [Escherichia coli]
MIFNTEVRLGFVAYGVRIEETDKVSSNNAVYIAFFLIKLNAFPAFSGRDNSVVSLNFACVKSFMFLRLTCSPFLKNTHASPADIAHASIIDTTVWLKK